MNSHKREWFVSGEKTWTELNQGTDLKKKNKEPKQENTLSEKSQLAHTLQTAAQFMDFKSFFKL